jgi:hypothetical protein
VITGKRKRDEAHEPAQNAQQRAKKVKKRQAHEQLAEQSHTAYITESTISRSDSHEKTMDAPEIPKVFTVSASTAEADKNESTEEAFMNDVGMHLENPDASTKVVSDLQVLCFGHACFNRTSDVSNFLHYLAHLRFRRRTCSTKYRIEPCH